MPRKRRPDQPPPKKRPANPFIHRTRRKLLPVEARAHDDKRWIHAHRFERRLPHIAAKLGLPIEQLRLVAEAHGHLCWTCRGPFVTDPHPYLIDGELRALFCVRCQLAMELHDFDPVRFRKHARFRPDYRRNRGRLGRFMILHMSEVTALLPVEATGDLIEYKLPGGECEAGDDAEDQSVSG